MTKSIPVDATQEMVSPNYKQPNDVQRLAFKVRAAIDQYVYHTGLKPEWIGMEYGKEITVSIHMNPYEYKDIDQPYGWDGGGGPGGEVPPRGEVQPGPSAPEPTEPI